MSLNIKTIYLLFIYSNTLFILICLSCFFFIVAQEHILFWHTDKKHLRKYIFIDSP